MAARFLRILFSGFVLMLAAPAFAHVGTSSVFLQGKAGPYAVYITVSPPAVIPGEAQISVLCNDPALQSLSAQANVLGGVSARNMPAGQPLEPVAAASHDAAERGPREFTGTVWIMTQGSWQVRLTASGARGSGAIAVPLPASPVRLMHMSKPFGALLIVLGLLLIAAVAAIAAAALREAAVDPGAEPTASDARHGRMAAAAAVLFIAILLVGGDMLWRQEISRYTQNIYRPLEMTTALDGARGILHLRLRPPSTAQEIFSSRRLDDLILDHNHLMHLYAVRWPAMDFVYHLHPTQVSAGEFDLPLPAMPPGEYRLFADIVHADGFPETAVAALDLSPFQLAAARVPLTGDDAYGKLPNFPQRPSADIPLADGFHYLFVADSLQQSGRSPLRANTPTVLRFTLLDAAGRAPADMQNYMGMLGHLAVLRSDGSVFAHIHPDGSAAMAAMMMANAAANHPMEMPATAAGLPNIAAFPFGFPSPGTYRLIIQMKHGGAVETGATDVVVH